MTDKEFDKFTGALIKINEGDKPNLFSSSYFKKVYKHKNKNKMLNELNNFLKIANTEYDFERIEKKPIDLLKSKLKMISLFFDK
jgi:hypothetical protein